jgi:hypothetical protein
MSRDRRLALSALAVSLVLTAGACGGSDTTDDAATASTVVATTDGAEAAPTTTEGDEPTGSTESTTTEVVEPSPTIDELDSFAWTLRTEAAPWSARAGLRVVDLDGRLILLGGRTPNQSQIPGDSRIWADVWASDDGGATWEQLRTGDEPGGWPARAYFQAVVKDDAIYVLGGQDFGLEENPFCALLEQGLEPPPGLGIDPDAPCPEFLPTSQFFNDVWRSTDGITWEQLTEAAPWPGRAGLSAAVLGDDIYVFGGSQNDDSSIIGPGGPARIYYNDVWRSSDGVTWEEVTDAAPWEPRAGAAVVVRGDEILLLGGEDGFTCEPLPDCEPPYFNDVWSTSDGATWELLTADAGWSARPGHVCEMLGDQIVCFGGFGLITNPNDMWASVDGVDWTMLTAPPWNATDPLAVKYDFDATTFTDAAGVEQIVTVGGDRETFDFTDPENYLRVDNDVWAFAPPS